MDDDSREIFARLLALSAIQEARIKANPLPFLNDIARENHKLRSAINEALYIISGASSLEIAQEIAPRMPPSIVETALARNRKAADVLAHAVQPSP